MPCIFVRPITEKKSITQIWGWGVVEGGNAKTSAVIVLYSPVGEVKIVQTNKMMCINSYIQ